MQITTPQEFWIAAECWYQRTHRLREIAESKTETPERKSKALRLFLVMTEKVLRCSRIAFQMQQPKAPPDKSRQGGINKVDHTMN